MTADQEFSSRAQSPGFAPDSGFSVDRPAEFDLLVHFHHNETPICSLRYRSSLSRVQKYLR